MAQGRSITAPEWAHAASAVGGLGNVQLLPLLQARAAEWFPDGLAVHRVGG